MPVPLKMVIGAVLLPTSLWGGFFALRWAYHAWGFETLVAVGGTLLMALVGAVLAILPGPPPVPMPPEPPPRADV